MGLTQIEYVNEWNNDIIHGKGIVSGFLLWISVDYKYLYQLKDQQ